MADGRVQVFARVRPLGGNEAASPCCVEADAEAGLVSVRDESATLERVLRGEGVDSAVTSAEARQFTFDGVFHRGSTQRDVFAQVGVPVLRECMNGFNGTILAYGQTGSGKTFSLLNQAQGGEDTGLLPRLVAGLFVQIARDRDSVYQVEAAALQVYNEQVDDLLAPGHHQDGGQGLNVQSGGAVPDLTWVECTRPDQMLEAFSRARANLIYAETKMNKASSRSHALFQMRITRCRRAGASGEGGAPRRLEGTRSVFTVVDLAGSERVKKSGAEGARFQEATAINKSLLSLGNVVSALAAKKRHVPTRDSKLTRLLEGSLGGNCKTSLLVCVSPAVENQGETVCTLEFASRAMCVEVDAKVNSSIVEVSASALVADVGKTMGDLGVHFGSELEALRKSSSEALERAEEEARRQQRAAEAAAGDKRRLQQAMEEADKRARSVETEAEALRIESRKAREEAEARARAAERLEEEVHKLRHEASASQGLAAELRSVKQARQQADAELERLRQQARQADEAAAQLRATVEESSQQAQQLTLKHGDITRELQEQRSASSTAAERASSLQCELQLVRQERDRLQERLAASDAALADREAALAEERSAASGGVQRASAAEGELRRRTEELDRLRARADLAEAALARERARSEVEAAARQAQLAEADGVREASAKEIEALRLEVMGAEARCRSLEEELARARREGDQRSTQLEREADALRSSLAAAEVASAALKQSHANELTLAGTTHGVELARLQGEWSAQRQLLEGSLEDARARSAEAMAGAEARMQAECARWASERASLTDSFDERVAALTAAWEEERASLRAQLERSRKELVEKEAQWKDAKEEEVRKAWETGNQQQRRLAAAFKAARCVSAAKEAEIRHAHESLATRFEARESRPEDRKAIERAQKELQDRERAIEQVNRVLQNRDENDRIFGAGLSRPTSRPPCAVPLGGHRRPGAGDRRPGSARRSVHTSGRSSSERPRRPSSAHCSSRSDSFSAFSDQDIRCTGAL